MNEKALPPPSAGSTQMTPPCASTTRRQTARPIPLPVGRAAHAREHVEDPRRLVGVDADAVVAHGHDPLVAAAPRGDVDERRLLAAELDRVADEVLQDAAQMARVAVDLGQRAALQLAPASQLRAQVLADLGHQRAEVDALGRSSPARA